MVLAELSFADIAQLATELRRVEKEWVLLALLVELIVILAAAHLCGHLARKFRQPAVMGELIAGLLLGPSFLARVWPAAHSFVFHPAIYGAPAELQPLLDATLHWIFTALSQIGLVLLLFLLGLEFDFSHLRLRGKSAIMISFAGMSLPFVLGMCVAPLILPHLEVHPQTSLPVPALGFTLFMGTAMSITALPMLGRIMLELGITPTRLGAITISAAAVDDALGWIMLAIVAALAKGSFQVASAGTMIALTIAYALLMVLLVGPWLRAWARRMVSKKGDIGPAAFAGLLILVLLSAIVTSLIGIFAIFGAFLIGAVLSAETAFRDAVNRRLHDLVTVFFVPIFFTYTGLRTRIDALDSPTMWAICGVILLVAVVGKLGGCALAAWATGFSRREALCIGAMMNTRGLMELIVINAGYELGVIPPSVFCMLVLMALITTFMTTPLLLRFMRGTELEPYILKSGFST